MCFSSVDEIERFVYVEMRKRFPQYVGERPDERKTIAESLRETV
jgi:hypothetical protein